MRYIKHQSIFCLAIVLIGFAGCCTDPGNFRNRIEQSAISALPPGVRQSRFAYIGEIQTDEGRYHVVEQRRILDDMLAPRGLPTRLLLFSDSARLAAVYESDFSSEAAPLWCAGARVYFSDFGSFHFGESINRRIPPDGRLTALFSGTNRMPRGNVIDFSRGPLNPLLTREKHYGSSGGLKDDPWQVP